MVATDTIEALPASGQAPQNAAANPFRDRHWTDWLGKGLIAVVDQGLVSGSNFTLNILLGRWLSHENYAHMTALSNDTRIELAHDFA